jgi:hypothetical protein
MRGITSLALTMCQIAWIDPPLIIGMVETNLLAVHAIGELSRLRIFISCMTNWVIVLVPESDTHHPAGLCPLDMMRPFANRRYPEMW